MKALTAAMSLVFWASTAFANGDTPKTPDGRKPLGAIVSSVRTTEHRHKKLRDSIALFCHMEGQATPCTEFDYRVWTEDSDKNIMSNGVLNTKPISQKDLDALPELVATQAMSSSRVGGAFHNTKVLFTHGEYQAVDGTYEHHKTGFDWAYLPDEIGDDWDEVASCNGEIYSTGRTVLVLRNIVKEPVIIAYATVADAIRIVGMPLKDLAMDTGDFMNRVLRSRRRKNLAELIGSSESAQCEKSVSKSRLAAMTNAIRNATR